MSAHLVVCLAGASLCVAAACGSRTGLELTRDEPVEASTLTDTSTPDSPSSTDGPPDAPSSTPVVVLFGGRASDLSLLDDTWTWDGSTWRQLSVSGPPGRATPAAASLDGTLLVFGGLAGISAPAGAILGDTWLFDGASWNAFTGAGPSARVGASAASDGNGHIVLFGGAGSARFDYLSDTWEWDAASWSKSGPGGPGPRTRACMGVAAGVLMLFGGFSPDGPVGDTWTRSGPTWTRQAGPAPTPRTLAACATLAGRVVLFGGLDSSGKPLSDTWEWDGSAWTTMLDAKGPGPRFGAMAAALGSHVVLFGGEDEHGQMYGDTWTWDGATWSPAASSATAPTPRWGAAIGGGIER